MVNEATSVNDATRLENRETRKARKRAREEANEAKHKSSAPPESISKIMAISSLGIAPSQEDCLVALNNARQLLTTHYLVGQLAESLPQTTKLQIIGFIYSGKLPQDTPDPTRLDLALTLIRHWKPVFLEGSQPVIKAAPFVNAAKNLTLTGHFANTLCADPYPDLSTGLETARQTALARMPPEAIPALTGRSAPPTNPLEIFALRTIVVNVLAPILAQALSKFHRTDLNTAAGIMWGDEAALEFLNTLA